MADLNISLRLLCVFNGECAENGFIISIGSTSTTDDLGHLIMTKLPPELWGICPDQLSIWLVQIIKDDKHIPILLDFIPDKMMLPPDTKLSMLFPNGAPTNTVHIILQHHPLLEQSSILSTSSMNPSLSRLNLDRYDVLSLENARLRKELEQIRYSLITFKVSCCVGQYADLVQFKWSTKVETATVAELKMHLYNSHPKYVCDDQFLQIDVSRYDHDHDHDYQETISDDESLRALLRATKAPYLGIISLRLDINITTPYKNFSSRTYEDVCNLYGVAPCYTLNLASLSKFTHIFLVPSNCYPNQEFQKKWEDLLIRFLKSSTTMFQTLPDIRVATRSRVVNSFLCVADLIFEADLFTDPMGYLSDRRGYGPIHTLIQSRKDPPTYTTIGGITVVKGDLEMGIIQNVAQLESAMMGRHYEDGIFQSAAQLHSATDLQSAAMTKKMTKMRKTYGIVTDAETWVFLECTLYRNRRLSFQKITLPEKLDYRADGWENGAKSVLGDILGLCSLIVNEIRARGNANEQA